MQPLADLLAAALAAPAKPTARAESPAYAAALDGLRRALAGRAKLRTTAVVADPDLGQIVEVVVVGETSTVLVVATSYVEDGHDHLQALSVGGYTLQPTDATSAVADLMGWA